MRTSFAILSTKLDLRGKWFKVNATAPLITFKNHFQMSCEISAANHPLQGQVHLQVSHDLRRPRNLHPQWLRLSLFGRQQLDRQVAHAWRRGLRGARELAQRWVIRRCRKGKEQRVAVVRSRAESRHKTAKDVQYWDDRGSNAGEEEGQISHECHVERESGQGEALSRV